MNLSKVWEIEKDKGAWHAAIHGISKSRTWVSDRRTTREHLPNLKPGVFQTGPDWIDVTCSKVALAAQCKMIWRRPKAKVRVIPLQTRLLAQSRIQVRNYTGLNKGMAVRFKRNTHDRHLEGIIEKIDDYMQQPIGWWISIKMDRLFLHCQCSHVLHT